MLKYNFTSDLRISVLNEAIATAAKNIANDTVGNLDKSGQNNTATLSFYFNLKKETNTLDLALRGDITQVIRNFVIKFQYPNPYTSDLLKTHIEDNTVVAPLRIACRLLIIWSFIEPGDDKFLSYDEIRYFIFCNPPYWIDATVESYKKVIDNIKSFRESEYDLSIKIGSILDWKQYERQSRELITTITYASSCFKTSKSLLYFSFPNVMNYGFADEIKFISDVINYSDYWSCNLNEIQNAEISYSKYLDIHGYIKPSTQQIISTAFSSPLPLQQILFGAPGTGKSHYISQQIDGLPSIRTTFHPDSDYSSFVGCYKPTKGEDGITYCFTPQAFVNAYVAAWRNVEQSFFLIIEEINRGNCAQIFGDVFQLLDRDSDGRSSYRITPDQDLAAYLSEQLADCDIDDADIKHGRKMQLPPNLHIWATMNTSDQSLFPIDSAFKRRWEWKYIPIDYTDRGHYIACGDRQYSWADFLLKVNERIEAVTQSEDKKLGYWFMGNGMELKKITAERFVSKVVFYLWSDVFKDFGCSGNTVFKDGFDKFHKFFDYDGNPKDDVVMAFLDSLGAKEIENIEEDFSDDEDGNENNTNRKKGSKYSYILAGEQCSGIGIVVRKVIKKLCQSMNYDDIRNDFDSIVEKKYNNDSAIQLGTSEELGLDESGRMRWWKDPFTSADGKVFSVTSLWPDYYYPKVKDFVEHYPILFPGGLQQVEQ